MTGQWTGAGFPLGLLLALAMLTAWLQHAVEFPNERPDGKHRHDPDYFIEGARITKLSQTGTLQYTTDAERIEHFPDTDTTEFRRPNLRYLSPGRPPLTLTADSGWANAKGDEVRLIGNVVAHREAVGQDGALRANMTKLTVFAQQERAVTDVPVLITQGRSRLQGTGMVLDNKSQTFVLQSRVSGQFESKPRH